MTESRGVSVQLAHWETINRAEVFAIPGREAPLAAARRELLEETGFASVMFGEDGA